jgi:hypothetical protein
MRQKEWQGLTKPLLTGTMVTHPGINEPIRVKNSNEVCTTVERISQPMLQSMDPHKPLGTMRYPVYIVATENLTLI